MTRYPWWVVTFWPALDRLGQAVTWGEVIWGRIWRQTRAQAYHGRHRQRPVLLVLHERSTSVKVARLQAARLDRTAEMDLSELTVMDEEPPAVRPHRGDHPGVCNVTGTRKRPVVTQAVMPAFRPVIVRDVSQFGTPSTSDTWVEVA